jgi:hypothetical protein
MTSSKFALGSLLVVSAALILAACGGGDDDGSGQSAAASSDLSADRAVLASLGIESASDEEVVYYTAVDAALDLFTGTAQNAAGGFGPTSDPNWEALRASYVGTAFVEILSALQAIDAPASYSSEHAALVGYLEELVEIDVAIGDAAVAEDSGLYGRSLTRLQTAQGDAVRTLAPNLCRLLTDGGNVLCNR